MVVYRSIPSKHNDSATSEAAKSSVKNDILHIRIPNCQFWYMYIDICDVITKYEIDWGEDLDRIRNYI